MRLKSWVVLILCGLLCSVLCSLWLVSVVGEGWSGEMRLVLGIGVGPAVFLLGVVYIVIRYRR